MTMLMFTCCSGAGARMPSTAAVFRFSRSRADPVDFFANALSGAANILTGNTHLISKVVLSALLICRCRRSRTG
jgi:hypothetical protein